jgi:hypothetical protein
MRQRHGNAMKFSYITRIDFPEVPLELTSEIIENESVSRLIDRVLPENAQDWADVSEAKG